MKSSLSASSNKKCSESLDYKMGYAESIAFLLKERLIDALENVKSNIWSEVNEKYK